MVLCRFSNGKDAIAFQINCNMLVLSFPHDTPTNPKSSPKKPGKKLDPKDNDSKEFNKKKQCVEDSHKHWHNKSNENFSERFWKHSSKCPKTKNGAIICMKFFIKGFCSKNCNIAHKLSPEEESEFESFIKKCQSLDFQQGAVETQNP